MINILDRGLYKRTEYAQCAWAILIMMKTGIRVGNEKSSEGYMCINAYSDNFKRQIKTYGVITILKEHCQIKNYKRRDYRELILSFAGKKNVEQTLIVGNKKLIDAFIWLTHPKENNQKVLDVTHYDLTKFVKRHLGGKFTIKDIRTAKVNKLFIQNVAGSSEGIIFSKKSEVNKYMGSVIELTAEEIGHTKGVCKSAYVSPHLFNYYKGYLLELLNRSK